MTYYRLYHLNRGSGHIDLTQGIDAIDDVQAVAMAKDAERPAAAELWQEGRKVLRLEAPHLLAPPHAADAQMAGAPDTRQVAG